MTQRQFTHYVTNHYSGTVVWVCDQHHYVIDLVHIHDVDHRNEPLNRIYTEFPIETLEMFIDIMVQIDKIQTRLLDKRNINVCFLQDEPKRKFAIASFVDSAYNQTFRSFIRVNEEARHQFQIEYPYIAIHKNACKQIGNAVKQCTTYKTYKPNDFTIRPHEQLKKPYDTKKRTPFH